MGIFDKINGKNIEQKVSEYSEIYGEVLLGVHRDVKSLESKMQTLSALFVSDDGQTPSNAGFGAGVQVLQTKLRIAEKLISEAKADHDREIPELRQNHQALVCRVASLDAEITQQFRSVQDQSEELRGSFHSFERQTEGQINEVRADSSKMDRRLHELKTALDELAGRVGHQTSVLCALRADHDRVKRSVQTAELGLESAATSIRAIEEAAEVTNRGLDAIRKNIRVAIRVGAGIGAVLLAVTGVILWTLESAK